MRRIHFFLFLAWTLLALVVLWQYDPVDRKLDPDASFMVYAGQQILRGHAPYVGVAIVKLPLAPLVAAFGIAVGRAFRLDDILAARILFWLCAGVTVGAVYLIGAQLPSARNDAHSTATGGANTKRNLARVRTKPAAEALPVSNVLLGSLSAALLLSSPALGVQVAEGPEAKLPMICAGMLCIVLLARAKFFWAGVTGALAFLAWQPGLIFIAAALICSVVVSTRKRALVETLSGIVLPLLLVGIYLVLNGTLDSMFHQAFGANTFYFGEKKNAAVILNLVRANLTKVWGVSLECSLTQAPLVVLGFFGMFGGALVLARWLWDTRDASVLLRAFPLLLSGAALFAFSLLDFQKCSDVTPLLPYLALGGGFLLYVFALAVTRGLTRATSQSEPRLLIALGSLVLGVVLFLGARAAVSSPPQTSLAQQRALANEIAARLHAEDRVQQFGDATLLVATGRENATRYVHLGTKQGLGILLSEGERIQDVIMRLEQANPRLITLSRAKHKAWARPLYRWIKEHYAPDGTYNATTSTRNKDLELYWKK